MAQHGLPATNLGDWVAANAASLRRGADGALLLHDGEAFDWQLMKLASADFRDRWLRVRLRFRPLGAATLHLTIDGGINVVQFNPDGPARGSAAQATCTPLADGGFQAEITYWSPVDSVLIGAALPGPMYEGTGAAQFAFDAISVEPFDAAAGDAADPLVFVDVGARYGMSLAMKAAFGHIRPVLVEPDPEAAAPLREEARHYPGALVLQQALHNRAGRAPLHVTRHPGCSSLLRPNTDLLRRFPIADWFDVEREIEVDCIRYDSLHAAGTAPAPDAIKIDVQGAEYEVLQGFGALLETCLGIELEAHLQPVYVGERLLPDIVSLLADFGFALARLQNTTGFGPDEIVEFDAWFLKRPDLVAARGEPAAGKMALLRRIWDL